MLIEYKGIQISVYADELGDLTARVGGPLQLEIVTGWAADDEEAHLKLTRAARAVVDAYFRETLLAAVQDSQPDAGQVLVFRARMRA